MVEFTRKVFCDCCGMEITDFIGGYKVRCLGADNALYDICNVCCENIDRLCKKYEDDLISFSFEYKGGRDNEA